MFTVTVETGFRGEHQLSMADGQKEPLHAHDWVVRAAVSAEKLNEFGVAVDFIELKQEIDRIVAGFNDVQLEELDCFGAAGLEASAENVAKYIYDNLEDVLQAQVELQYVEVTEAEGCWAKYCR